MMNSSDTTKLNQPNSSVNKTEVLAKDKLTKSNAIEIPYIFLPKGEGALKGADEKLQVNAAHGTAYYFIPLPNGVLRLLCR